MALFEKEEMDRSNAVIREITDYLFSYSINRVDEAVHSICARLHIGSFRYKGVNYNLHGNFQVLTTLPKEEAIQFQAVLDSVEADGLAALEISNWLKSLSVKRGEAFVISIGESIGVSSVYWPKKHTPKEMIKAEFKDDPTYRLMQTRALIKKME